MKTIWHHSIVRVDLGREAKGREAKDRENPLNPRWTNENPITTQGFTVPSPLIQQMPAENARVIASHLYGDELILVYQWEEHKTDPANPSNGPYPYRPGETEETRRFYRPR